MNVKTKIDAGNFGEKLQFSAFQKEFIRIATAMKDHTIPGGDSIETAIPVYIKKGHKFVCGKEKTLVVLAAKSPAWKKEAKKTFGESKEGMLSGKCYVSGDTLKFIVNKGTMKMPLLKKEIKAVMKKVGLKHVAICDGAVVVAIDNTNTGTDAKTTEKEIAELEIKKEKGRSQISKMTSQIDNLLAKIGIA